MKRNVSGQIMGAQMTTIADGSIFTGAVTCYVTGDNGVQTLGTVGSGVCAHKGNGLHNYVPSNAETDYDFIQFTFVGTGAVTHTIPVYTVDEIAESVWDAQLTDHLLAGSFGLQLGNLSKTVTSFGQAQAGSDQTITLEAGAPATNFCDPGLVLITGGTGAGQSREIVDYNTTTKVATVARTFRTPPDSTSTYVTLPVGALLHSNEGIAQGGGVSSITLNASAPSGNDSIKGQMVWITGGMGQDQVGVIDSYNGTTKIATMTHAWVTAPDATSVYTLLPLGGAYVYGYMSGAAPLTAAGIRSAVGMASANLDTQLAAIDDAIDTEVGAIKVKTDQLTFGATNTLNANITHVIAAPIQENGDSTTNWGGPP